MCLNYVRDGVVCEVGDGKNDDEAVEDGDNGDENLYLRNVNELVQ